jgi:hypothetical protein
LAEATSKENGMTDWESWKRIEAHYGTGNEKICLRCNERFYQLDFFDLNPSRAMARVAAGICIWLLVGACWLLDIFKGHSLDIPTSEILEGGVGLILGYGLAKWGNNIAIKAKEKATHFTFGEMPVPYTDRRPVTSGNRCPFCRSKDIVGVDSPVGKQAVDKMRPPLPPQ